MSIKLAIDPGHGMGNVSSKYDPGATAGGLEEADIALAWGLTLKWVAEQSGLPVFMTRDDDTDVTPVGQRDDRANAAGCTHFLSLHCNAAGPTATGVETFYRDDKTWAASVQQAILGATGLRDRGLKTEGASQHARLAVLNFKGQACLVELGFISNSGDRKKLTSRDARLAFARSVVKSLGFEPKV